MFNYIYDETTGIVLPNTEDVKTDVETEFKEALQKPDLDTTEATPQGRLIEAETVARKRTIENMAFMANMFNPQQAYGVFLDSIAALFGIERVGATRTRVTCTLTGTSGTTIPAGSQAKDTAGNIYYLENSATIGTGGSVSADFLCTEKGAIECEAGTLTQIVTAISGWQQITNPSAGQTGLAGESDNTLRDRIKIDQFTGQSLLKAIHSAIMRVEEVEDCLVIDNSTNTNDTSSISGVTIPPHSLFICVEGGDNTQIAKAIFDNKSGGCGYTTGTGHTVTVNVQDDISGQIYPVSFDRPVYQEIDVEVKLATGQSTTETNNQVKQAIVNYSEGKITGVDGLVIGKNVSPFEIASAITQELPDLYIADVKIAKHGQTTSATEITINPNEKATITKSNITVS